jgi:hypothetical protein
VSFVKNIFAALVLSLLVSAAAPAGAFWIGNPASVLGDGETSAQGVFDMGTIELESGNTDLDMDVTRLYVQGNRGFGSGFELFGRLLPMTGKLEFENSTIEPDVWGLGVGARWTPAGQTGPLRWGGQFSFDWNQGDDQGMDVDLKRIAFSGGAGYAVERNVDVYGGLTFMSADVSLEGNGSSSDADLDTPIGLFAGLGFRPAPQWTVGLELHLINEQIFGFTGAYRF